METQSKKRTMSRRSFLSKSAMLGAAGFGMPYIIPSGVLAMNGNPGANDRIVIGGIGVGRQGLPVIDSLSNLHTRVAAVADVDLNQANAVAERYDAEAYQDYRALLDRDDIDAVVVATPDQWHALNSIHAAQAGKDIYCEKPLTLTVHEGRVLTEAVRKYDRVLQTGSQQRSSAIEHRGCTLIRNGRIGKVQRIISANYESPWHNGLPGETVPEYLDWDMWCGPVEPHLYHPQLKVPRGNPGWISFFDFSGGEMTGWGTHGFDQVQWALGMDEGGPIAVWTEGDPFDPPTYTEPEGLARGNAICAHPKVYMEYPDGIVMELGDGPRGGAIFMGVEGSITIDRGILRSDPEELIEEPLEDPEVQLYQSTNHHQDWLDCIKERRKPICDVEIGHRSATVCHLGNIARWVSEVTGETGQRLEWDPVAERFTNSDVANTFLDRERRPPYQLPETV